MTRHRDHHPWTLAALLVVSTLGIIGLPGYGFAEDGAKMCGLQLDEAGDNVEFDANCAPDAPGELAAKLELADHFYEQQMYYRAVGAYEEVAFFTEDPSVKTRAQLQLAMAYHLGGQYQEAVDAYEELLDGFQLDDEVAGLVRVQRILALADHMHTVEQETSGHNLAGELEPLTRHEERLYQPEAQYQLVRMHLLFDEFDKAEREFEQFEAECRSSEAEICQHTSDMRTTLSVEPPGEKSPALGAALSTVLPGAGSVYAEHYVDGMYYLGMTGLGTWISLELYDFDDSFADQRASFYAVGTLALSAYLGNVLQGYVGVHRYNRIQQNEHRQRAIDGTSVDLPLDARY